MGNDKSERRLTIDQLVETMRAVEPELARREPAAFAAARREGGTLALLVRHPDLRDEYHRRLNAPSELRLQRACARRAICAAGATGARGAHRSYGDASDGRAVAARQPVHRTA